VDGFSDPGDASGTVKAVLVLLTLDDAVDFRDQLTGVVGVVEPASLILMTAGGDRCVNFDVAGTNVFQTSEDAEGNIVFGHEDTSKLASGQQADAFGTESSGGCLVADTIIYQTVE
jgi:hypothetical protein